MGHIYNLSNNWSYRSFSWVNLTGTFLPNTYIDKSGVNKGMRKLTRMYCPKCGTESIATLYYGFIVAHPEKATIKCGYCDTDFRIEFFEVDKNES